MALRRIDVEGERHGRSPVVVKGVDLIVFHKVESNLI